MVENRAVKLQKFDDVFDYVGQIGVYQVVLCTFLALFSFWGVEVVSITFIAGEMPHWCRVPELTSLPPAQQRYIAIPPSDGAGDYSQCSVYRLNFSRYSLEALRAWNRSDMVTADTPRMRCAHGWLYEPDLYLSTSVNRFNLVCSRQWLIQFASTIYIFGILIGAVTSGLISDSVGRKKSIMLFVVVKLAGGLMSAFAVNYPMFAFARFLVGVGSTGCFLGGYVLSMEMIGSFYRTIVGTGFNLMFSLGFMTQPLLSYFIRDDFRLQLAIAIPNFFFLSYWLFIPESARWLVNNGDHEKAIAVLRKMARINKRHFPQYIEFQTPEKKPEENKANVMDLFRNAKMRKITLIIYLHWFVDSLMYYGLSLNTSRFSGTVFVNTFIMGAVEMPANIAVMFLLNWSVTGRRYTCSLAHIAAAVTSFATVPFVIAGLGTWSTVLAMVGKAFVTIGFSGIYVFSAELFPTEVRNIGLGTASMCARVSGMLAPFVGGPLAELWPSLPSVIFGTMACLSGTLSLFLPETRGQRLCDTISEVDSISHERKVAPFSSIQLVKRNPDIPESRTDL